MPKRDDVVLYTRQGRTVNALVLAARNGESSHLGAGGELLLTLAITKQASPNAPHKRPSVLQDQVTEPEIEIVRDVVHESHEFSAEFRKEKGLITDAQVAAARGDGEWRDAEVLDVSDPDEAPEQTAAQIAAMKPFPTPKPRVVKGVKPEEPAKVQ